MGFFKNIGSDLTVARETLDKVFESLLSNKLTPTERDCIPQPVYEYDKDNLEITVSSDCLPIKYTYNYFSEEDIKWLEDHKDWTIYANMYPIHKTTQYSKGGMHLEFRAIPPRSYSSYVRSIDRLSKTVDLIHTPYEDVRALRSKISKYLNKATKKYVRKKYDLKDVIADLKRDIEEIEKQIQQ